VVIDQRMAMYDAVADRGLHHALVVMSLVPTGTLRPMYPWDFTRNGTEIDDRTSVLYALDCGRGLAPLLARYPDRAVWRWDGAQRTCIERCR
jgi:hypothetical protein